MTQAVSTHNTSFHSVEHDRQSVPDPDRVAYFEKAGWQAYYDRKWLRVLRLMVQLNPSNSACRCSRPSPQPSTSCVPA